MASAPAMAMAQAPPSTQGEGGFTLEQRRTFYEKTRRDHVPYVLTNVGLPGLGNILNDQPFIGAGFAGVFAISVVTLAFGLTNDDPQLAVFGGVLIGTTYAGSMITTSFGVDAYNAKLRKRYKLDDEQVSRGPLPGLTVSFAF